LNSRQKTSLFKGFNVGVNATVLAAKRAGEGRHRRFGMGMQVTQQAKTFASQYASQRFPAFEGNCTLAYPPAALDAMPSVKERCRIVFEAATNDQFYSRHGCTFNLFDGDGWLARRPENPTSVSPEW
jgi:hypothetical protein